MFNESYVLYNSFQTLLILNKLYLKSHLDFKVIVFLFIKHSSWTSPPYVSLRRWRFSLHRPRNLLSPRASYSGRSNPMFIINALFCQQSLIHLPLSLRLEVGVFLVIRIKEWLYFVSYIILRYQNQLTILNAFYSIIGKRGS
jgi:hypothetical protein